MNIEEHIRIIKDFPKAGINFYDIGSLLAHAEAWKSAMDQAAEAIAPYAPDIIVGIEARGFLMAPPIAERLGLPIAMIRKQGKLPGDVLSYQYDLEYGSDCIELQQGVIKAGARVAMVDDLLATGGTMGAAETLIRQAGAEVVQHFCLIELDGLSGREKLSAPFQALLKKPA